MVICLFAMLPSVVGHCEIKKEKKIEYKIGEISQYQRYNINDPFLGRSLETIRVSDKNIWFDESTFIWFARNKSNNNRILSVEVQSNNGGKRNPFFYLNIDGSLYTLAEAEKTVHNENKDVSVYGGTTYVRQYSNGWSVYTTPPVVIITTFSNDGWLLPEEIVNKIKKADYVAIRTNSGNRFLTEEITGNALVALKVWATDDEIEKCDRIGSKSNDLEKSAGQKRLSEIRAKIAQEKNEKVKKEGKGEKATNDEKHLVYSKFRQ